MYSWDFAISYWKIAVLGLVIVLSIAGTVVSARRLRFGWRLMVAECLRFAAILAIVFALLKPELVKNIELTSDPEIVVLQDKTGSMKTEDVPTVDDELISRQQSVNTLLESGFDQPLEKRFRVTRGSFAEVKKAAGGTDLNQALKQVLQSHDDLRAVILLTDGSWNTGKSPVAAATAFRARNVPIFPVGTGSNRYLPDVKLKDVRTPAFALEGEHLSLPFVLENRFRKPMALKVNLKRGQEILASKQVTVPALSANTYESLLWRPRQLGEFDLTLEVPDMPEEVARKNNRHPFTLKVRQDILDVLMVDSLPRWEYRYTRNALDRDPGVNVQCLLFHPDIGMGGGHNYLEAFPDNRKELSKFDVIFLGDVGVGEGELSNQDVENIRNLVEFQGSGLIFLPGARGRHLTFHDTKLDSLYPVVLDRNKPRGIGFWQESRFDLTAEGQGHLLTMLTTTPSANRRLWRNTLPGFHWNAAVIKKRPGANVLAVHSAERNEDGRMPILVTKPFGNGQVLFMGTAESWRWRRGVEDLYHYRFWGQVIRWMAHRRHMAAGKTLRVFYSPEKPELGETVRLTVTAFDQAGYPLENADLDCVVRTGNGAQKQAQRFKLTSEDSGWGVYAGSFQVERPGKNHIVVTKSRNDHSETLSFTVPDTRTESVGYPVNDKLLKELARITKGQYATLQKVGRVIETLETAPRSLVVKRRAKIWGQWWLGAGILGFLTAYWIGRKLLGLF